ncbi:MAG: hypothetical protein ACI9GB_002052 [Halioglobus sp.]|jgi:hypothetical protein
MRMPWTIVHITAIAEICVADLSGCVPSYKDLDILNQRNEGACAGFALAAAINRLNRRSRNPLRVSERMLYEMAKRHDEWAGEH